MDIFVLIGFGFLLLIFILIYWGRHKRAYQRMMAENTGVQPLFKLRSAQIKHQSLRQSLQNNPDAMDALATLHADFKDGRLSAAAYETALDELQAKYLTH